MQPNTATPTSATATRRHISNARDSILEARLILLELLANSTDDADMFTIDRLLSLNSELQGAWYELDCFAVAGGE